MSDPVKYTVVPVSTSEVTATTLPVDLVTTTWRTMLRVVVPTSPGDVLDISAWARVTNDVGRGRGDAGYTVGVGWHLWAYDADLPGPVASRPWWRLGPSCGDNVTRARHHMPLSITAPLYTVPEDWPQGHRMVVVLRADAHSTAAVPGDVLAVDPDGVLTVRRYVAEVSVAQETACVAYTALIAAGIPEAVARGLSGCLAVNEVSND